MKKGRKKKGVKSSKRISRNKGDFRESSPFKLLKIFLVILGLLIIAGIISLIIEYEPREEAGEGLEGELGTLKWDVGGDDVEINVLDYNITYDNETIQLNLNWSEGNRSINAIFIEFEMREDNCNHSISITDGPGGVVILLPPRQGNIGSDSFYFGINKTWDLYSSGTNCYPRTFENLTGVTVYAQIHINLTQTTKPIPNITRYNDDPLGNVVDLDDYFSSEVNINYTTTGDTDNKIRLSINSTTSKVSFSPDLLGRHGIYEFNLTASEVVNAALQSGDVLTVEGNNSNMTFYVEFINSDRPIPNNAPDFKSRCDDFSININNTATVVVNMSYCFEDDDGDSLTYKYDNFTGNVTTQNITISANNTILILTAKVGYLGTSTFKIYADDGIEEVGHDVDVRVYNYTGQTTNTTNTSTTTTATTTTTTNETKIVSSSPAAGNYDIFSGKDKNFSINAENYDSISWYLDDALVASNVTNYGTGELEDGTYVIRVEINGAEGLDSKTWTLIVGGEEPSESVSVGKVIFWSIVAVVIIIILLIIWLFIAEKNKLVGEKINGGLGVSLAPQTSTGKPQKSGVYKYPR